MAMSKRNEGDSRVQRRGEMTVREAGKKGGHKGGQRVRELIQEGKEAESKGSGRK